MLIADGFTSVDWQQMEIEITKVDGACGQHVCLSSYFAWRVPMERLFAMVLLVLAAPLLLVLIALVRATSEGAAIYRQTRVGKDGTLFELLKIRTMYQDAEKATGPVWCRPGDSRITPLGAVLRRLHL